MKRIVFLLTAVAFVTVSFGQSKKETAKKERIEDKIEQYFFVMLKTGPKQDFDSAQKQVLFKGHMDNINRLYYEGILKVAGPFGKNDLAWRGIFIFDCKTKEEAEKQAPLLLEAQENYVQTDPAVTAGLFAVDIVPWYSSPIGSFKHGKPKKL